LISISLLPREYRLRTAFKRWQRILLLSGAVILVAFLLIYGFLLLNNSILQNQLEGSLAYRQTLNEQIKLLAPYENIYGQVEKKSGILVAAKEGEMNWFEFLAEFGRLTPQEITLTDLNANSSQKDRVGEVRIRGRANNKNTVAGYLTGLEQLPGVSDLRCRYLSTDSVNMETQFEINLVFSKRN